jgi:hypothetical protein
MLEVHPAAGKNEPEREESPASRDSEENKCGAEWNRQTESHLADVGERGNAEAVHEMRNDDLEDYEGDVNERESRCGDDYASANQAPFCPGKISSAG